MVQWICVIRVESCCVASDLTKAVFCFWHVQRQHEDRFNALVEARKDGKTTMDFTKFLNVGNESERCAVPY